ncbi:MAG: glycosyltransferase family 2 protein [Pseudomonadales bacterium]|jgi:GT2 family glycosyltransferase|nr:glycosyltransferase family 2 protein [Pseudomonadales bacterium]
MILSIIIVSYNTAELTVQTVLSVEKSLEKKSLLKGNLEIIVVDNDSKDSSVADLKNLKLPYLKIIANPNNDGFGAGNNLGLEKAKGDYVLFLNSDTIVQAGALDKMVDFYRQNENEKSLGLVASMLLNPNKTVQGQGGDKPSLFTVASQWLFWDDIPLIGKLLPSTQHTGSRAKLSEKRGFVEKGWVGGTAVMCSRSLINKIGAWDKKIFMYGEDVELCLRANLAGYKNGIYVPSKIVHYGCASSSSKNAILGEIRGLLYLWSKYFPKWQLKVLKLILRFGCNLRILLYSIRGKENVVEIYKEGKDLLG